MMRTRRTLLYMPGSDWRKIEKASELKADSICMDLEDGVALDQKEGARAMIAKALKEVDFGGRERLVRINQMGSGFEQADLEALLPFKPDGIVLPKVSSAEDLKRLSESIGDISKKNIALLAQIESAKGLINIKEIAAFGGNLEALIFGAEDYSVDVGAIRSPSAREVLFARSSVVAHAAANALQAIDMLWIDYKDNAGLETLALQGLQLGFDGMQIIHPNQIDVVHKAYAPSGAEIAQAERIIKAYDQAKVDHKGVFALDGKMVDMPIVLAARKVLARQLIK